MLRHITYRQAASCKLPFFGMKNDSNVERLHPGVCVCDPQENRP